jgi:hypothetical protein
VKPWTRAALAAWVLWILAVTVLPRWWQQTADAAVHPTAETKHALDLAGNVVLFAPLGVLLILNAVPWRRAVVMGAACSVAIEVVQLLPALNRDAAVLDVVANTIGVAVGCAAGRLALSAIRR